MYEQYSQLWWVWICAALVLGILEIIAPGFVFLGFAIGAALVGGLLTFVTLSSYQLWVLFAALSLIAWFALRRAFPNQSPAAKIIKKDIND